MRKRLAVLAAVAATTFLLAGCTGSSGSTTEYVGDSGTAVEGGAPEAMVAPDAQVDARGEMPMATAPVDRQVIRSGTLTLRADEVGPTVARIRAITSTAKGYVTAENTSATDAYVYSSITIQVPAASLDDVVAKISALGTVESVDLSSQDVTSQTVDLDARIAALQASVDRMTDLMAQASDVNDLMAIEAQLSARQADLDSLKAQRSWLGEQVAMSTLNVTVSPVPTVEPVETPGFANGLENGWAALISAGGVAVTAFGFFLPFLILCLLITIPVVLVSVWAVRRHRRRMAARVAAMQTTAPAASPAVPSPPGA